MPEENRRQQCELFRLFRKAKQGYGQVVAKASSFTAITCILHGHRGHRFPQRTPHGEASISPLGCLGSSRTAAKHPATWEDAMMLNTKSHTWPLAAIAAASAALCLLGPPAAPHHRPPPLPPFA